MIIDGHVHISEDGHWPGSSTAFALSAEAVLKKMDHSGVEKAVVLPLEGINDNLGLWRHVKNYPDRFIPFCMLDFKATDPASLLSALVEAYGFRGLKIHSRRQRVSPGDPRLEPVLRRAAALGLPVVFDCYPQSGELPMEELSPYAYDRLAKAHPELNMILAHAGVHRLWDAYFVAKSNPNVYLDISYILDRFREACFVKNDLGVVCEQLDKKIIYGSDSPECDLSEYLGLFHENIPLARDKCDRILGGNMAGLLTLR